MPNFYSMYSPDASIDGERVTCVVKIDEVERQVVVSRTALVVLDGTHNHDLLMVFNTNEKKTADAIYAKYIRNPNLPVERRQEI